MGSWTTRNGWSSFGTPGQSGAAPGRDSRIDTLRGLFLVVMTLDHLPAHPLLRLTKQSLGFVSAAEGFVFLSGLVSAWVYGKGLHEEGEPALCHRAWSRARDLYVAHVLIYTVALLANQLGGLPISAHAGFWAAWWRGALLIHQPALFGILPMYVVFLLLLPFLLTQFAKGRAAWIWAGSFMLWLVAQSGIGSPQHNPVGLQLGFFNILAWQLLFVAGAYFGSRKAARQPSVIPRSALLLVSSLVITAFFFAVRHQIGPLAHWHLVNVETAAGPWKTILHPWRLIDFASLAYLVWYVPRSADRHLNSLLTIRFLRFLGGNSLQVFAWSILVCHVVGNFGLMPATAPIAWRMLLPIVVAWSLIVPAWLRQTWLQLRSLPAAPQKLPVQC